MRYFLNVLGVVLWFATVLALFFIFTGEPDLWDKWHNQAMGKAGCTVTK